ncbi:MAG: pyruvate, phosphate dikinase [Elusimicrobiota bacterium]
MTKRGSKFVLGFGGGKAEGSASMKSLLGGKGANLAEMSSMGLPVPAGFTITTEACSLYYKNGKKLTAVILKQVEDGMRKVERLMGRRFGDPNNPLLVSVRSGAAISMPGMMDTVLNLGLNPNTIPGLIRQTKNERLAWDSYRRFIQMYGNVVMNVEHHLFEDAIFKIKRAVAVSRGIKEAGKLRNEELNRQIPDTGLGIKDLQALVKDFLKIYRKSVGKAFPNDPMTQLKGAINAVFGSWNNYRAVKYREINNIRGLTGTAVNVQAMVFGNMGDDSGTGVCFSRDPSTGKNAFYGEYLINAQGEDVVAGIRTPEPLERLGKQMPKAYKELCNIRAKLERRYRDMQDMEFTIEKNKLYMLQTRTGKRTAAAAIQIAVDLVRERLITKEDAVMSIDPNSLDQLLHDVFDTAAEAKSKALASGLPASPGAGSGRAVFNAAEAEAWAKKGEKVILVRIETSPEDIGGMDAAEGILTARGGMTSHAAVVARGMGKCCVAGSAGIDIDYKTKSFRASGKTIKQGDWISLNGSKGNVYEGRLPTQKPTLSGSFKVLMGWADSFRRLGVRTNADTPADTKVAVGFGAEGIGLTRTEHMFFEGKRIVSMREMILASDEKGRRKGLAKLLPMQRKDFEGIFTALEGRPCTIRLLDPPLHEFLPHDEKGQAQVAKQLGVPAQKIKARVEALHESNPMLGHRGCRLSITYPEIAEMQARAIIEAAVNVRKRGIPVSPEIMIPLIGHYKEYTILEKVCRETAEKVFKEKGRRVKYLVGTMIEVPRAALTADKVAEHAEFFSFGTNDLTQMACGFSRDDAGVFLSEYTSEKIAIYPRDPFEVLDVEGVGQLVEMSVKKGRAVNKNLKCGICGEHGGEPASVTFCHNVGLDYVSCSPYRVPIARLAAAQAAVKAKRSNGHKK